MSSQGTNTDTVIGWVFRTKTKTPQKAIQVIIHESLHDVTSDVTNTIFTEALFDALCGRKECGLWFGAETFKGIIMFLQGYGAYRPANTKRGLSKPRKKR